MIKIYDENKNERKKRHHLENVVSVREVKNCHMSIKTINIKQFRKDKEYESKKR